MTHPMYMKLTIGVFNIKSNALQEDKKWAPDVQYSRDALITSALGQGEETTLSPTRITRISRIQWHHDQDRTR